MYNITKWSGLFAFTQSFFQTQFLLSKDIGGMAKRQIENIKKKYISFKALTPNIVHRIVVYKKEIMIKDDEQVAFSNQIGKMLPNYIKNHGTIFIVWWLTLDVA